MIYNSSRFKYDFKFTNTIDFKFIPCYRPQRRICFSLWPLSKICSALRAIAQNLTLCDRLWHGESFKENTYCVHMHVAVYPHARGLVSTCTWPCTHVVIYPCAYDCVSMSTLLCIQVQDLIMCYVAMSIACLCAMG